MRNLCWLTTLALTIAAIPTLVPVLPTLASDPARNPAACEQPDLESDVRRLIKDLSGDTRTQRIEAERRLVALGPQVLSHLPAPDLLPSNSVREVVRRIRLELERTAAIDSVRPALVTLDGAHSLRNALTEIARQTGNRIEVSLLPDDVLQHQCGLKAKATPFWQALDELASPLGLRYDYDAGRRGLKLLPSDVGNRPVERAQSKSVTGYAGAFRIEALPGTRTQTARGSARDQKSSTLGDLVRFTLLVRPEPRLRPLFLQFASNEVGVQSQDGVVLAPLTPEANIELALSEAAGQARLQMDYVVPASIKVTSVDVQGNLLCTTAAGNEALRFTELTKLVDRREVNIARCRGGVTVVLSHVAVSRADGKCELRIKIGVSYDTGGPAFETHRSWMLHNEVYLEDPTGKRWLLNGGSETTQQGNDGLGITYRFVGLPDPLPNYTFVYVAPTLIVDVPIEFQIKSVPIQAKP